MKTRIWKEIRAMLPIWAFVVLSLLVVLALVPDSRLDWRTWTFWLVLGCAMLGTVTFGQEFHHHTLPLLLAQGVDRHRIWWEKMFVLGIGLGMIFGLGILTLWLSGGDLQSIDGRQAMRLWWLIPMAGFCTAPFWTLVARNGLGGILFTVMFPPMMFGLLALIGEKFAPDFFHAPANDRAVWLLICGELLLYCLVLFCWGYRIFVQMQVTGTGYEEVKVLPRGIGEVFAVAWERGWRGRTGTVAALVKKEIRLHKLAFALTGAFCFGCGLLAVVRDLGHFEWPDSAIVGVLAIHVIVLPMVLGAVSTAEERNLGILEAQLMLPAGTRRQWLVKCLTTLGLCVAMGLALPALVLYVTRVPLGPELLNSLKMESVGGVIGGQMLMLALAMYASTLSHNSIRALLLGVGLWAAIASGFTLIASQSKQWMAVHPIGTTSVETYIQWLDVARWIEVAGGYGLGLLVFWLAYANYRMSEVTLRRLVRHAAVAFCALLLWVVPEVVIRHIQYFKAP